MSFAQMEKASHQRVAERSGRGSEPQPFEDLGEYLKRYAQTKPASAALICLAIGFVLGWKLKPW
jgi:hypothetical protein